MLAVYCVAISKPFNIHFRVSRLIVGTMAFRYTLHIKQEVSANKKLLWEQLRSNRAFPSPPIPPAEEESVGLCISARRVHVRTCARMGARCTVGRLRHSQVRPACLSLSPLSLSLSLSFSLHISLHSIQLGSAGADGTRSVPPPDPTVSDRRTPQ